MRRWPERTSWTHWRDLALLLGAFERLAESCSRLDAYRLEPKTNVPFALSMMVERRFDALSRRVDSELDRVTAERLQLDVTRKRTGVMDTHEARKEFLSYPSWARGRCPHCGRSILG